MRYLLSIIVLLGLLGWRVDAAVVADPFTRVVSPGAPAGSPSNFTNAVNQFNALSIDGARRTIVMTPGTFAMAVGTYRLHVSNNISIKGSGMNQTTITGIGLQDNPMIRLFDNCEISDVKLVSSGTGANPQLGAVSISASHQSSTNVLVQGVWLSGDDDNLWLTTDGGAYSTVLESYSAIDWTIHDSIFENNFDSVAIFAGPAPITDVDGDGWDDTGRTRVQIYNSRLISSGPSLGNPQKGDVTNIRVVGNTARVDLYGCYLESSGGTNTTSVAFMGSGPSGADSTYRFPGGLYLNSCQVQIYGTNLATGGNGASLVQNTNGWVFLNGVQANSNNIIGTGTNYWYQPRQLFSSTTTAGTVDATELVIFTNSIIAGTLTSPRESIEFYAAGTYAATAITKNLRVRFGGTEIFATGDVVFNNGEWAVTGRIVRLTATTQKCSVFLNTSGASAGAYSDYTATTINVNANTGFSITGDAGVGAAANEIVVQFVKASVHSVTP